MDGSFCEDNNNKINNPALLNVTHLFFNGILSTASRDRQIKVRQL